MLEITEKFLMEKIAVISRLRGVGHLIGIQGFRLILEKDFGSYTKT